MARFKMTSIFTQGHRGDINKRVDKGDSVIVVADTEREITGNMVKNAIETQLGKELSNYTRSEWTVTKL